ncbi:ELWxxDGT repeat protein [uncultured Aquimarina sp.]|uniref:ELWxxDGT repeat protein n=1 Tax=uncultured Aquimarina sp. TaxID=575652 RepID=UPI0026115F09|nr:ELWxxDGT repeat protein [uncultured Aquimarina sp.]
MRSIFTLLFFVISIQISAQQAYLVKDINTETNGSADVRNLIEFKDKLVFVASSNEYGSELWETDGTLEGTKLMVDVEAGRSGSSPRFLTILGDKLFFQASDRATGQELWVTDGTQEGTERITDLNPGPNGSSIGNITVYNGKLYFGGNDGSGSGEELWVSDGTTAGTHMVKNISEGVNYGSGPNNFKVYNGKLYFSADDGIHFRELWVTDGTEIGTHMVKNINSSMYGSSDITSLTVYNGKLYFQAYDGSQYELWESDGTEIGTKLAVDINPSASSFPRGLTVFNNKLYLSANYGTIGSELFETDGTPAGTRLVKDINVAAFRSSSPSNFTIFNNKLYFSAYDDTEGNELWETDGTEAGTRLVKDVFPGTTSSNVNYITVFNNRLFFGARNTNSGDTQLWSSDGTEAGTQQFYQIEQGTSSSNAQDFIHYNNEVYFRADDDIHGTELWKSDGTQAGTQMVKDIYPGSRSGIRNMLGIINGKLYFEADDGVHGDELWVTDGTEAGTQMVKDIHPGSGSSDPYTGTVLNGEIYFAANDGTNGEELWVSDGTETGTRIVKDINPGTNNSYPFEFATYNNKIYFNANDGINGNELWESDGTEAGTKLVKDIFAGASGSDPRYLTVHNNKLYFQAYDNIYGGELWVTDGTEMGTQLVKDIRTGTSWSSPQWMASYRNKLYFRANDGVHGDELWESDGTEAGTKLTVNIKEGSGNGSGVAELVVLQDRLYFRADDGVLGPELWVTDGTVEGTRLAADMDPGTSGSDLDDMVVSNGKLFFNADDGKFGEEIWAYEPFDCSVLTSNILYVSPTGTVTNYGNSWAEATSLQNALQLAAECASIEEIWVQQGTYKPGVNRYDTFSIPSNIKIYGGFNGTETSLTERDWVNNKTILNGDAGIPNSTLGNSYTLLTLINTKNTLIDGFLLEKAFSEFDHDRDNLADTRGGGIYLRNANNNSFINCVFRNNLALEGGAIYQTSGTNNQYINCLFYENEGQQTNTIFVETGSVNLINSTLVNNTAVSGNGILGTKDGAITFANSILDGNHILNFNTTGTGSLNATYSYLKGEHPSGTGNTDGTTITDVLFKDLATNDFTLQGSSPLIDKGNNAANTETKDLEGKIRVIDGDNDTTATIDIGAYEFGQAEQAITFTALTDATYGDADFDLTATADSGLTVTYTSSDTSVATISGNTVTIIGAGTTTITASQAGNPDFKPATDVTQDLKVNGRKITVTADAGQSKVFGDAEPTLTYTITSGSLINSDVLSGVLGRTDGENAGFYPINQGTVANTNYDITFVANDFEITKADQIITFNNLSDVTYGDADFNLNATSDSGLAIDYTSSDTSVATISRNTVTILGVGITTITASQAGNINYNAATNVTQTLRVTPKAITITADSGQGKVFGSADPALTYTITSGSLVGSDVLTGNLTRTIGEDVGFYAIQQGTITNTNYDITFVANDFEITKADQTITFNGLVDVTYGDADFDLNATSDAGLAVSYTSSDTSVATVSGNTVTIIGVGTTSITANQAGNGNYNQATPVSQTLQLVQRPITVTADAGQNKIFGTLDPMFTYTITNGNLVASDVLIGNAERTAGEDAGFYPINQGTVDNINYDITFVTNDFEITKADQSITFNPLADVTYGDADFNVNANTTSGLTITYNSSDTSVATVSGNTVTIIGMGTTTITVSQAGNSNYNAATAISQTLTVTPKAITITADAGQSKVFGSTEPVLTYSITSGSLVGSDVLSGNLTRTTGEAVGFYVIQKGTVSNINYDITFVANDFEITKADQNITFNSLSNITYGDADFNLNATTDSGLTVSYASSDTSVATVTGNTVTIVGVGITTIRASQAGNTNYNAATAISQTLTVTPRAITITADAGQSKVFGNTEPVLTYSITSGSLAGSDVLTGNLTRTIGEDVGFYAIQQGTITNVNYDITFVANDFEIIKADQSITFNPLADAIYGDADFNLNATASSGLTITYSSSDTNVATVSGNIVTIVGAGTTTITAIQEGNGNYSFLTENQTLTVLPKTITVTTDAGKSKVYGTTDPVFTYTITNGNLVANDILTGNLGRVAGEDVGIYSINQGTLNNSNYNITFESESFEITKATQVITFTELTNVNFGDPAFDLNATTSSGLVITYSSSNTDVVTISGNMVTIVGEGSAVISAHQSGNENYLSADFVSRILTVLPGEIQEELVRLYPNPVVHEIQISETPSNNRLSIYDANGKLVKQVTDYSKDETINVATLPSGTYLIKMMFFDYRGKTIVKRFIKQ